jgi:hypothetical protein
VSRRRPAEINGDDDQDDSESQLRPSKKVRQPDSSVSVPHRKRCVQEDDDTLSERSRKDICGGDSSEEDDDADLQQLGDEDLASVFASEVIFFCSSTSSSLSLFLQRAHWSSKRRTSGHDVPDVELTSTSEVDGRSFKEDQDIQEIEDNVVNLLSEDDDDDPQDFPSQRHYKVQFSLVSNSPCVFYESHNRFPSVKLHAALRYRHFRKKYLVQVLIPVKMARYASMNHERVLPPMLMFCIAPYCGL